MSRDAEFHQAGAGAPREVSWRQVQQANVGPHGPWNGADDGEVEEDVRGRLGVREDEARWTHERVALSELGGAIIDRYAEHHDGEDCPHCYSRAAASAGPPVPLVHDGVSFHAPDGRHRITGAYANGETHIDAFVARRP